MKRHRVVLVLASLVLGANTTYAQTGINLAWNDCITQTSAASNIAYACDGSRNGTPFKIVFSFFTPVALTQFVGIDASFDILTSEPSLPDWWRLGSSECRADNLGYPSSLNGIGTGTTGACRNPWLGGHTGGAFKWVSGGDSTGVAPGHARLLLTFARDNETSLSVNQQYLGGVITLDTFNDVDSGGGQCAGCTLGACIALNQVQLYQTVGAPGGDIITITEPETQQVITWRGGPAGGCQTSAPSRRTWGSIRAVYH